MIDAAAALYKADRKVEAAKAKATEHSGVTEHTAEWWAFVVGYLQSSLEAAYIELAIANDEGDTEL